MSNSRHLSANVMVIMVIMMMKKIRCSDQRLKKINDWITVTETNKIRNKISKLAQQ